MGKYSDLPSVDVDPFIETRSKIDYSNYLGEQRTSKLKATLATSVCENLRRIQFADDTLFKSMKEMMILCMLGQQGKVYMWLHVTGK